MPVPHHDTKHSGRLYVSPHRLLEYREQMGRQVQRPPRSVIVGWQNGLAQRVRTTRQCREINGPAGAVLELTPQLGYALLPVGAPIAAIVLEEMAALGVETVIGVGTAGAIGNGLNPGEVVVCSAALRDEGTSHHYAPSARWAYPDLDLLTKLRSALPQAPVGPTWTTDAPYRETVEEITAYRSEGVLTVDMEAAALFTVGAAVGVQTAAVFCISDTLHGEAWTPSFHSADLHSALWALFERVESVVASPEVTFPTSTLNASPSGDSAQHA